MASITDKAKRWWVRFRRWQVKPYADPPIDYGIQTECLNCGDTFTGNYCPRCGQTKNTRRFTLRNAVINFFEVWGLTNSTFMRTVVHLLLRPGRMIGDYLRGHRQPYFPPIRMLFIIVAIFIIVDYLLPQYFPNPVTINDGSAAKDAATTAMLNMIEVSIKWINEHVALSLLAMHMLLALIATWLFRKSPRLPRSTIVENFYAQVYICCQLLILGFIAMLFTFPFAYHSVEEINEYASVVIYIIDYKQLYGMKWWATIWRSVVSLALLFVIIILISVMAIIAYGIRVGMAEAAAAAAS